MSILDIIKNRQHENQGSAFRFKAQEKLSSIVSQGQASIEATLENIADEYDRRLDLIVTPKTLDFEVNEGGVALLVQDRKFKPTDHSARQLFERVGVPKAYADKLIKLEEYDLLKSNLDTLKPKTISEGAMVRSVGDVAKGFLSTSYRRMDAFPIFEGFIQGCLGIGFAPYVGHNTTYRYNLTYINPEVVEVAQNEFVVFALSMTTGDYGNAGLSMNLGVLRVICSNLAVGFDTFKKVHLGKRWDAGEEGFVLSNKTQELDTRTIRSALNDVIAHTPRMIEGIKDSVIKSADDQKFDPKTSLENLKKKGFSKDILEKTKTLYEVDTAIEMAPVQKSRWKWSNCLSYVAKLEDTPADTRLDLEREAWKIIGGNA